MPMSHEMDVMLLWAKLFIYSNIIADLSNCLPTLSCLIYYGILLASGEFCRLLMMFASSLDVRPDTDQTVCHSDSVPERL